MFFDYASRASLHLSLFKKRSILTSLWNQEDELMPHQNAFKICCYDLRSCLTCGSGSFWFRFTSFAFGGHLLRPVQSSQPGPSGHLKERKVMVKKRKNVMVALS